MSRPMLYVASSWRNAFQPGIVQALRGAGFGVYDFRHPPDDSSGFGWSSIDPLWQSWDARKYRTALEHPIAVRGYHMDWGSMNSADACVLVLPAGASAHIEAGFFIGRRIPTFILMPPGSSSYQMPQPGLAKEEAKVVKGWEPELMYKMATAICLDIPELMEEIRQKLGSPLC